MSCDDCIHAIWKRTSNGRLHPKKTGRCGFNWEMPPLPKAFYFYGGVKPSGGFIERGETRTDGCPYFQPVSSKNGTNT